MLLPVDRADARQVFASGRAVVASAKWGHFGEVEAARARRRAEGARWIVRPVVLCAKSPDLGKDDR